MAGKVTKTTSVDETTTQETTTVAVDAVLPVTLGTTVESVDAVLLPVAASENGTVVPEGETVSDRKAVVFLGPYHNYSRSDMACFEAEIAAQLVERNIAVWPKDAKKALSSRPGEFENDLDIG